MKKEIIEVDKKRGVYQITTTDERWYTISAMHDATGLPYFKFIPSVTWITSYVYKGVEFYKWLASKGWDEAEAIKTEAGDRGTKIHKAIEKLIDGEVVKMDTEFENRSDEKSTDLEPDEYSAVNSFIKWCEADEPEFILSEVTLTSEEYDFAGTVDAVARINGEIWIVDWKSSQYIWPSMKAQISAYKVAIIEMMKNNEIQVDISIEEMENAKMAVLQVGYKKNKRRWKFTEIQDEFESLFLPAQKFWDSANKNQQPKQYELPMELKLSINKKNEEKKDESQAEKKDGKKNVLKSGKKNKPTFVSNRTMDAEKKRKNVKATKK